MKIAMLSLLLIGYSQAFAAPAVVCGEMSYVTNADGSTVMDSITNAYSGTVTPGVKSESIIGHPSNKNVLLTVSLRQMCAQDGGPCSENYELNSKLAVGDSESSTSTIITPATLNNYRQSLTLKAGNISAFVNCDYNNATAAH